MTGRPEHSQSSELGEAIQLDPGDTLDGDPTDEPLDSGYVPPDRPYGAEHTGTTADEQREGESLDQRLAEEEPDDAPAGDPDRSGRLVADGPDTGDGRQQDLFAGDVGIDGGAASAEEAAVHREDG